MSNGNLTLNTPQFTLYSYSLPLPSQICFSYSYSVSLVCISVFLPAPQCFHYCSFILFFSIWLLFISSSCLIIMMVRTPYTVQFSLVTQSCPTLRDPMTHSTPGLPVHHQLPEFTQTPVHRVGDAIQPSHPQSSPSPPAPNPSQHQSPFQWVNSLHEVAKVLEFQL